MKDTKVSIRMIKWMEKVSIITLMVQSTKGSTKMVREKAKEHTILDKNQTGVVTSTKGNIRMVKEKEKASTISIMVKSIKDI